MYSMHMLVFVWYTRWLLGCGTKKDLDWGAEELTGKDETRNKNQGREISRTWKSKQSRRAVRGEDAWTDTEQTHGDRETRIQWI